MNKAAAILLGVAMSVSICGTSLAAGPDYRSGTPWPAIDLEGVVTEDMNASIKDNFALAVNKDKRPVLRCQRGLWHYFGTTFTKRHTTRLCENIRRALSCKGL